MMRFSMVLLVAVMGAGRASAQTMPTPMEQHDYKTKVASVALAIKASGKTTTYTVADLQAMPQRTLVVHNGHSNVDESYSGVGLAELLARAGYTLDNGGAKKVYHSYLRAEGTDHYYVIFSASEVESALHNGDAIVALSVDGKPLTEDGQFKFIASADRKPARWVTNLNSISIVTVD